MAAFCVCQACSSCFAKAFSCSGSAVASIALEKRSTSNCWPMLSVCVLDMATSVNNEPTLSAGICFFVANTTHQMDVGKSTAKGTLRSGGLTGLIRPFNQSSSGPLAIALVGSVSAIQLARGWRPVGLGYFCPNRHSSLLFSPGSTARRRQIRLKMSWAESSPSSCHFKLAGWTERWKSGTNATACPHKLRTSISLRGSTSTGCYGRFLESVVAVTRTTWLRAGR